jgi:putative MATE family efflux protein
MTVGLLAVIGFNLADTYFVARLGTRPLAAMGFTFPVTMLVTSLTIGLGTGTSSALSRAIGQGEERRVRQLATDGLALAFAAAVLLVVLGLATIDPLFRLLGATDDLLPMIRQYMLVWYAGIPLLMVPMVGNAAIRATGDARSPSLIMLTAAGVNIALDPLLIFGLLGFPRLELRGAAIATVVARAMTLVVSLAILHFREGLLLRPRWRRVWRSWRAILHVAAPAAATNLLAPLSFGVTTWLAARFGPAAVAAVGTASRIEALALIPVMALGASMVPFVGQNWGAGRLHRIRLGLHHGGRFALTWGMATWLLFLVAGGAIAALFTDDPEVSREIVRYLWIVPLGYGMQGVALLTATLFNGINRPLVAAAIQSTRMVLLYLPLAAGGAYLYGLTGLFTGICLTNLLAGAGAWGMARRVCHAGPPPGDRRQTRAGDPGRDARGQPAGWGLSRQRQGDAEKGERGRRTRRRGRGARRSPS